MKKFYLVFALLAISALVLGACQPTPVPAAEEPVVEEPVVEEPVVEEPVVEEPVFYPEEGDQFHILSVTFIENDEVIKVKTDNGVYSIHLENADQVALFGYTLFGEADLAVTSSGIKVMHEGGGYDYIDEFQFIPSIAVTYSFQEGFYDNARFLFITSEVAGCTALIQEMRYEYVVGVMENPYVDKENLRDDWLAFVETSDSLFYVAQEMRLEWWAGSLGAEKLSEIEGCTWDAYRYGPREFFATVLGSGGYNLIDEEWTTFATAAIAPYEYLPDLEEAIEVHSGDTVNGITFEYNLEEDFSDIWAPINANFVILVSDVNPNGISLPLIIGEYILVMPPSYGSYGIADYSLVQVYHMNE